VLKWLQGNGAQRRNGRDLTLLNLEVPKPNRISPDKVANPNPTPSWPTVLEGTSDLILLVFCWADRFFFHDLLQDRQPFGCRKNENSVHRVAVFLMEAGNPFRRLHVFRKVVARLGGKKPWQNSVPCAEHQLRPQ
jgi:hypothetical protein